MAPLVLVLPRAPQFPRQLHHVFRRITSQRLFIWRHIRQQLLRLSDQTHVNKCLGNFQCHVLTLLDHGQRLAHAPLRA